MSIVCREFARRLAVSLLGCSALWSARARAQVVIPSVGSGATSGSSGNTSPPSGYAPQQTPPVAQPPTQTGPGAYPQQGAAGAHPGGTARPGQSPFGGGGAGGGAAGAGPQDPRYPGASPSGTPGYAQPSPLPGGANSGAPNQQPGSYPPGFYPSPQPGSNPGPGYPPQPSAPGAYPPGAYPPGAYPPGAYPPGAYPPGAYPPGGGYPGGGAPAQPGYGSGYPAAPIAEPPLPRKRRDLRFSVRYNVIDLLFGKVSGELEYAFAGPFSVVIGPEYIFGDTRQDRRLGITARGAGVYGELGFWVEGHPLRGYFLKARVAHRSVTFRSDVDEVKVPQTLLGAMFGSQSVYGGWFTVSGGFGIAYDTQAKDRTLRFRDPSGPTGAERTYTLLATGPFQNGIDLITQLSIGASF